MFSWVNLALIMSPSLSTVLRFLFSCVRGWGCRGAVDDATSVLSYHVILFFLYVCLVFSPGYHTSLLCSTGIAQRVIFTNVWWSIMYKTNCLICYTWYSTFLCESILVFVKILLLCGSVGKSCLLKEWKSCSLPQIHYVRPNQYLHFFISLSHFHHLLTWSPFRSSDGL